MALITCPECNGQVSEKAAVCPHCGYPIAANTPQEKYAFCVKSQPIPTSTVQAQERSTAIRMTAEITGCSTDDAERIFNSPGSVILDKLTEREAAAVILNYRRFHIPTSIEQSQYTLREIDAEKAAAKEELRRKRTAENVNELFVFRKLRFGMADFVCTMCGQQFLVKKKDYSVINDATIEAQNLIVCQKCHRTVPVGAKIIKQVETVVAKDADSAAVIEPFRKKGKPIFDPDIVEKTEAAKLRCPKCSSTNIQFVKKGFDLGGAVLGGILAGGAGLIAGGLGSNDVMCVCSNCGHKWEK